MSRSVPERDYVNECPVCGMRLLGMSPEEYREKHSPECNPLTSLYVFQEVADER